MAAALGPPALLPEGSRPLGLKERGSLRQILYVRVRLTDAPRNEGTHLGMSLACSSECNSLGLVLIATSGVFMDTTAFFGTSNCCMSIMSRRAYPLPPLPCPPLFTASIDTSQYPLSGVVFPRSPRADRPRIRPVSRSAAAAACISTAISNRNRCCAYYPVNSCNVWDHRRRPGMDGT
jgi:hypothetical protein